MLSEREYYRQRGGGGGSGGGGPRQYWQGHSIIFHLIIINVALFLLSRGGAFFESMALVSGQGLLWQPWRLATYQFLHGDFGHILFNMYALWLFGRMVEGALGRTRFLCMYFFSGIIGGLFFLLANAGHPSVCVGASGSIFGVMVAAAMLYPDARFMFIFPPIPIKLWTLATIYCLWEILSIIGQTGGSIAHCAHLGGALGGFLFMRRLARGTNSASWLKRLFDGSLFRGSGTTSSSSSGSGSSSEKRSSWEYNRPSESHSSGGSYDIDQEELNRILDKMARQGYEQLTEAERESLRRSSEELKRRRGV